VKVRPLRPGQRRRVSLTVTLAAAAHLRFVACAEAARRVREARERNNCVVAANTAFVRP
jgi:hypothetical protein